jgi:hypothetical protein
MNKALAVVAALLITIGVAAPANAAQPTHNKYQLAMYLTYLHVQHPETKYVADRVLHRTGDQICRSLPNLGIVTVVAVGIDAGIDEELAIDQTAAAITFLCPKEQHMIDELERDYA